LLLAVGARSARGRLAGAHGADGQAPGRVDGPGRPDGGVDGGVSGGVSGGVDDTVTCKTTTTNGRGPWSITS
jgi:hypothetical protein